MKRVIDPAAFAFNAADMQGSIPHRFAHVAAQLPDHPAVRYGDRVLTYAGLNAAANRVAGLLLAEPSFRAAPVALLLGHDLPIFGAILGVLKAGLAYSALNPSFPYERNRLVLEDLRSTLILTDAASRAQAETLGGSGRAIVDVETLDTNDTPPNPDLSLPNSTLAAVFYTSGTTGTPKGVERTHAHLLHRSRIAEHFCPVRPGDVASMLYPCSVGASVSDLFTSLSGGATISLYDLEKSGINGLAPWLLEQQVSRLHLHTGVLRQLLDTLPPDAFFPRVRFVRPSDRLRYGDARRLRRRLPREAVVVHGLSSAEAGNITLLSVDHNVLSAPVADDASVPVGFPVPDVEVKVVDQAGAPLPDGEIGEIMAVGPYIPLRYWRRPELTAAKFITDPARPGLHYCRLGDMGRILSDGSLELVGRRDRMVKIRGHRVELDEVQAAVARLPAVRAAVVILDQSQFRDPVLVAYVELVEGHSTTPDQLRRALQPRLASHSLPNRFVLLDSMPLLPNGKVDHRALPPPTPARPALKNPYVAPRSTLEAQLAAIWADILQLDRVGLEDNFLDLGGHSLQAARIVNRILRTYQIDLPMRALFEAPTVAEMALVVLHEQAAALDETELAHLLAELEHPGSAAEDGDA